MPYGNHVGNSGNDGTEMDVFESINGWNGKIQHALHWDGYGAYHQKDQKSMTNWGLYDGNFHKFGMMWTPTEYIFYIDDVETWRSSAGGVSDVDQYMKLTMEVSGETWPGDWKQQTTKPITWAIDYVRVYAYDVKKPAANFTLPSQNDTIILGNSTKFKVVIDGDFDYLTTVEFYAQLDGGNNELIKVRTVGSGSDEKFFASWIPENTGQYTITVLGKKDQKIITSDTLNIVVHDFPTQISHLDDEQLITFPNPVTNRLNFSNTVRKVEIYDLNGRKIQCVYNVNFVLLNNYSKGVYNVVLNGITYRTFVVK